MPGTTNDEFEHLMKSYDAGIRDLAAEARAVMLKLFPKAEEKVYSGWRVIRYSLDGTMAGQFAAIGPQKKHVNIYFMNGTELDDPKGLLEGMGKNMRHVKLNDASRLKSADFKSLLKASAKLQKSKLQG